MVDRKNQASNIGIIGFMATGKTTIGGELAKSLSMEFIDIDKLIEEKMETTISEIFQRYGEEYFRQIEKETIEEVMKLKNIIISYGGGACLDPENIINIRKNSQVILLEADPETIIKRTENDGTRPLLKERKQVEDIKRIMDRRKKSYYQAAHIIIDTSNKPVSNIRDEIIHRIGKG